ncbi:hypothetical protein FRC17_010122 [Serendipita sp. 399]|nr:hypothetical protein FRC17_010122 [Serendipita sp. 399]
MADKFDVAVKIVQELPKEGPVQPTNDDKLQFYGWYKTATVGKVNTTRPGMLDFTGKAKWQVSVVASTHTTLDAWKAVEDLDPEEAKKLYVEKLISIIKATPGEESTTLLTQLE